jgi:ketosteroid isomerase-like protein
MKHYNTLLISIVTQSINKVNTMKNFNYSKKCLIFCSLFILGITSCTAPDNNKIEKIIINKEKQILDEWSKGRTMVFPENSADEITYFDPSLEKRLDGITQFTRLLKPIEYKFTIDRYEMINPIVQIHGEIAVLSYNLVNYSKNSEGGERKFSWNCTEVYLKIKNDWKIIHSHWSFTKPKLNLKLTII